MMRSPFIRFIPLLLLALATSCLVGCDKDDDDDDELSYSDLTGSWKITQTFSTGSVRTLTMTIAQVGTTISGSNPFGPVNGILTGNTIDFTIRDEDLKTFTGTAIDNDTMAGTFTERFDDLFRHGNWVAERM